MNDYTKDIGFWKRLKSFVEDVETGCCMGEEEKQMILNNCNLKILELQNISNCIPSDKDCMNAIQKQVNDYFDDINNRIRIKNK